MEEDQKEDKMQEKQEELAPISSLAFVRDFKDLTRQVGDGLKVKCEVKGSFPAIKFRWFRNEAPLKEEPGRVKVKDWVKGTNTQWSILRFCELGTQNTGFCRCEASSGTTTIKSTAVL